MKKFLNYLRYSDFRITFNFSPFCWKFDYYSQIAKHYPNFRSWTLRVLPFVFFLIIDDGEVFYSSENVELQELKVKGDPYEDD